MGVPQGIVQGPILFTVYLDGLVSLQVNNDVISFANDTIIIYSDVSWSSLKEKSEHSICVNYLRTNKFPMQDNLQDLFTFTSHSFIHMKNELVKLSNANISYLSITTECHMLWNYDLRKMTENTIQILTI